MKHTPLLIFGFLAILQVLFLAPACTNDELPPPMVSEACDTLVASYDTNVKAIIDESCAYSACHSAGSATGAPGNFTSYDGLVFYLNNDSFRQRVFNTEASSPSAMPPSKSVWPQSEKERLTEEELQIIECWLGAGFPEN